MAILKFLSETFAEGFIYNWARKAWNMLFKGATQDTIADIVKKKLEPKGLDDENIFSFIFAKAGIEVSKKLLLEKVLCKLEEADKRNGTKHVRNFRLIVAIDALGPNTTTTKDLKGKLVAVPDPAYVRPGITILEEMAKRCTNEEEFTLAIMATGAMQDAPFGTLDEFSFWFKKTAFPEIKKCLQSIADSKKDILAGIAEVKEKIDTKPPYKGFLREVFGLPSKEEQQQKKKEKEEKKKRKQEA